MSSAEPPHGRVRPMWVRIALWSFLSFGLLFTFVGALVMFATLRHTTNDYHEVLVRLSGDLAQEYEECGGDAAKIPATPIIAPGEINLSIVLLSLSAEYIAPRPEIRMPADGENPAFISSPARKDKSVPRDIIRCSATALSQFLKSG